MMPTEEEKEAQRQRNKQIAMSVKTGQVSRSLGAEPLANQGPERTAEQNRAVFEGHQQELTDEEVAARMQPEQPTFEGLVRRMAENYQTSPQYKQLLDQELEQISAQIAELTQRRNMIEMARRGIG